jgi:hypothetical protein
MTKRQKLEARLNECGYSTSPLIREVVAEADTEIAGFASQALDLQDRLEKQDLMCQMLLLLLIKAGKQPEEIDADLTDMDLVGDIATLTADLERARAEVRACCGERSALEPHLPDGWGESIGGWSRGVDGFTLSVRVRSGGADWTIFNHPSGMPLRTHHTLFPGPLAAMAAADAALSLQPDDLADK